LGRKDNDVMASINGTLAIVLDNTYNGMEQLDYIFMKEELKIIVFESDEARL